MIKDDKTVVVSWVDLKKLYDRFAGHTEMFDKAEDEKLIQRIRELLYADFFSDK